jgi:hypothetical protein
MWYVPQIFGRRFRFLVVLDAQRAARLGKTAESESFIRVKKQIR